MKAVPGNRRPARAGTLPVAAACACFLGCGPAPAREPPFEVLALPSDTLEVPWTNLPGAAWLGGTRWALVASDWNTAAIVEFASRSVTPLGGPRQQAYVNPSTLFAIADTIYLYDWGRRRTTVWTGEGRLLDSIPVSDALRGAPVRARDGAGQLYYEARPAPGRDGSGNRDSAAIVRVPAGQARFDTVARLAPVDLREMVRENSSRFERQIFSGDDLWGVWRDGTVWIARLLRNQIESVQPDGRVSLGPELPDPVYEVTRTDREHHLQSFPPDLRPREGDLPWALVFPPFVAAFTGPEERIWLEKSKPAADSMRTIHVLSRTGDLLRSLRLIGHARLLGVGSESILIAEQFERGVRLMQVRIPVAPAAP